MRKMTDTLVELMIAMSGFASDTTIPPKDFASVNSLVHRVNTGQNAEMVDGTKIGYYWSNIGNPGYRIEVGVDFNKRDKNDKILRLVLESLNGELLIVYELNQGELIEYACPNIMAIEQLRQKMNITEALQYMLRIAFGNPVPTSPTFYPKETLQ